MAVDNFAAHPKAESSAGDVFGGEERFEDSLQDRGGNAAAGICDGKRDSSLSRLPVGTLAAAQQQTAARRLHGVDGVTHQVAEHLANLHIEASHRFRRAGTVFDADRGMYDAALVERKHAIEELLAGDRPGTAGLLVKTEGLVADGRDPSQFALGDADVI